MAKNIKIILCIVFLLCVELNQEPVQAAEYNYILLSDYSKELKIGDEFYLIALTSNGKKPSFSSNNSKVASVNTYGKITAKKAGTAKIIVKIKNAEAVCRVTVYKTSVVLSRRKITLENGYTTKLWVSSSTGHTPVLKSEKKSIAEVDENGIIRAKKPGKTRISVTVDGTKETCEVTVNSPTVTISQSRINLYRTNTYKLTATSTSKSRLKWKTNKSSVLHVDNEGNITAIKHGEAIVTVTCDDVKKMCTVRVKQPSITMDIGELNLAKGKKMKISATVSSGVKPVFSSSNTSVATVDGDGRVTAVSKGRAYIYAAEDGVKAKTRVTVTE